MAGWCNLCRRPKVKFFIAVFILVAFSSACYNAETVSEMFARPVTDVCEGDSCVKEDKTGADSEASSHSPGGPSGQAQQNAGEAKEPQGTPKTRDPKRTSDPEHIHLIITFTNAAGNTNLQNKFTLTVSSLLKHATVPLDIYIIGEEKSQQIASDILRQEAVHAKSTYSMVHLDVDKLAAQLEEVVKPMQDHFSYKKGAYYNHALFFLSIAMHRVMPEHIHRVIMIDCDLKFKADIKELYDRFEMFEKDNIMGIGRDLQPVYRHQFWSYRRKNPGTRVGEPPPNGLTGFNSGVLLLDLDQMRNSKLYNSFLNREAIEKLTSEFEFKGHLGDQDFFTLLNMKYEELFHVLPCTWNRQLCTWWREHGHQAHFHLYFDCEGDVKIYHGNCGTPIPED